ncbi:MAG: MerR family transcriptional regulator [Anaerolineae bacterium]|uniref:MerR family transcriptional regulator n=1 Tax=Promineifilum sp. TaxID=2664178 RepID=UPI001E0F37D6|nr:MerR family transcriptional regulator [Anaerolineales bacterium]MCB8934398.1 MerR family transcriptional regulator [Promineifilum sp.]MCO5181756.1 MerR family transcriptional regulator [Promineifilum sp.]MCW5847360.1 MerR family transcriptional regulator [Anaerolineae bacterium]
MKISTVSKQSGLSADTLRYYERIGLLPEVNRSENGIRDFNELDVQRVEFIKCMRRAGLPIDVLIHYFALVQQGHRTIEARKEILVQQRALLVARMKAMQQTLDLLDHKISVYDDVVLKTEMEIAPLEE